MTKRKIKTSADNIYYVYVLFRPWDGSPFYIGKGKGNRWVNNGKPGLKHRNPYFNRILTKAVTLGLEIPRVKLRTNLTEKEAFEIEIAFIAAIGRGRNGPLANLTDGGEGASGAICSKIARQKRSKSMLGNKNGLGHDASLIVKRLWENGVFDKRKPPSKKTREKMSVSAKKFLATTEGRAIRSAAMKKAHAEGKFHYKTPSKEHQSAAARARWAKIKGTSYPPQSF